MSVKKKKKKKSSKKYSGIKDHKQFKGKLISPINQLPIEPFNWDRDFLPEHIWIDLLSVTDVDWFNVYSKFLDELDEYFPEKQHLCGLISDFGLIPLDKREEFIENNQQLIFEAFYEPIGRIISFYPESPCYWLLNEKWIRSDSPIDKNRELEILNESILRLLPGKDLHAGHIRTVPFTRLVKNQRISFNRQKEIEESVEILTRYPGRCTEEEKYQAQQFARVNLNTVYGISGQYKTKDWPKYFWRRNLELISCTPHKFHLQIGDPPIKEDEIEPLYKRLEKNVNITTEYLNDLALKHKYDLFNPERDEILLGLFSRLTRLYALVALNPNLWARDISGIIIRCLTDTAITFSYLAKSGTEKEFLDFKSYGEGKEKLLMLHLQETYAEKKSLEGKTPEDIAEDLGGGFTPELIDIELKGWTKKSARRLAQEAGLEEFYRLAYDPASSDVHGTWTSISRSNLVRCSQPLHRFHRIPMHFEPPLYVNMMDFVQRIYLQCLEIGIETLEFHKMESPLKSIIQS